MTTTSWKDPCRHAAPLTVVKWAPSFRDRAERKRLLSKLLRDTFTGANQSLSAGPVWEACVQDNCSESLRASLLTHLRDFWWIGNNGTTGEVLQPRLRSLPEIEVSYVEQAISAPSFVPEDDPHSQEQGYLDPSPRGMDVRFAWSRPHGRGAGVSFADLEDGWNLRHEDFASKDIRHVFGVNSLSNHGTGVLGVVIADDNQVGIVGVAPDVKKVVLTSPTWTSDRYAVRHLGVAKAIVHAVQHMERGDVLLLEVERKTSRGKLLPTETHRLDFQVIRWAVEERGIVVIEPAGNGRLDLDRYRNGVLNRKHANFRDSGAIMVGASDTTDLHNRAHGSNFGSRVDCYAWGTNVVTCGFGDLSDGGQNKRYTKRFSGTSAASPMIAGAALILQGLHKTHQGSPMSPRALRDVLSSPSTGTPQGPDVAGHIGVMPDLRSIINAHKRFSG